MALILCPKCKAEISDQSTKCPACQAAINPDSAVISPTRVRAATQTPSFFSTFFAILAEPSEVFGRILKGPGGEYTWSMLFFLGLLGFLNDALKEHRVFWNLLLIPVVMGIGWLVLWVAAWVNYHLGRWLGGTGSFSDLFDQVVWVWAVGCVGKVVSFFGLLDISPGWDFFWRVVGWGMGIWGFIFGLILLLVAHRFSMWKAFAVEMIVLAMIFIPLTILMYSRGISWMEILSK